MLFWWAKLVDIMWRTQIFVDKYFDKKQCTLLVERSLESRATKFFSKNIKDRVMQIQVYSAKMLRTTGMRGEDYVNHRSLVLLAATL